MKQVGAFLLITLSLLTLSCTKSGVEGVARTDSIRQVANHKVTTSDLHNYFLGVKGVAPTKVSDISVEPIVNGLDTVMYLVNYDDGWLIL